MRYRASLRHPQGDESGLVYMRARYYEPTIGRFLSEDGIRDGDNWFSYCDGDPVNNVDTLGKSSINEAYETILFSVGVILMISACFAPSGAQAEAELETASWALRSAVKQFVSLTANLMSINGGLKALPWTTVQAGKMVAEFLGSPGVKAALSSVAARAVIASLGAAMTVLGVWGFIQED